MTIKKSPFNLETCARRNILELEPYRCARDDYKDDGTNVLLDANENAYGPGLSFDGNGHIASRLLNGKANSTLTDSSKPEIDFLGLHRYPDPHQKELKSLLCTLRNTHTHTKLNITPENVFVGVGSDEAIDALLRCFCRPGIDKILTCPPTYGMYAVSAQVNDIEIVKVPLDIKNSFSLQPDLVNAALTADPYIKLVYVTSPGNPTASLLDKSAIQKILEHPSWNGIVVLDEAYIDFSAEGSSLAEWVAEWPNLVVMQTLSKAFGLAGIRLGTAFCSPPVARLLNNLKAPYNISSPTSTLACTALREENIEVMRLKRGKIVQQRQRLLSELPKTPGVGRFLGGSDANFLLVEFLDRPMGEPSNEVALKIYESLAEIKGVVVRFRGKELGCTGCLRITVGTEDEVSRFLQEISVVLSEIYKGNNHVGNSHDEAAREKEANAVIS